MKNYKPRSLYYQPKPKFYLLNDKKHHQRLYLFSRYIKMFQNLSWLFCFIFLLYILIPHLLARKRPMSILFWCVPKILYSYFHKMTSSRRIWFYDKYYCCIIIYYCINIVEYLSFINPERGRLGEILPEVMIFPIGLCPEGNYHHWG